MKILVSLVTVFTLFFSSEIATSEGTSITATVVNVTSNKGKVYFSLYSKDNFMKKPIQSKGVIIKDGKSTVIFDGILEGEYAIICYHDKNSNGKMDFESNGMPLEDYGVSNNVMNFGPPQYNDAKFMVADKNLALNIRF